MEAITGQDFLFVFPWKTFIPGRQQKQIFPFSHRSNLLNIQHMTRVHSLQHRGFNGLSIHSVISSLNIKHFLIMCFCTLILDEQAQRGEMGFLSVVISVQSTPQCDYMQVSAGWTFCSNDLSDFQAKNKIAI